MLSYPFILICIKRTTNSGHTIVFILDFEISVHLYLVCSKSTDRDIGFLWQLKAVISLFWIWLVKNRMQSRIKIALTVCNFVIDKTFGCGHEWKYHWWFVNLSLIKFEKWFAHTLCTVSARWTWTTRDFKRNPEADRRHKLPQS